VLDNWGDMTNILVMEKLATMERPATMIKLATLEKLVTMEKFVTLAEAKTHLSALVTQAEEGAEITVTRHGRPVARIIGAPRGVTRSAGDWGWQGSYDKSVFAPMTDDEAREEGWPV